MWARVGAILVAACLFGIAGCSGKVDASKSPKRPRPVLPDASLAGNAYSQWGMPAIEKTWGPAEYAAASQALQKIASESKKKLPRYHSVQSGELFARMCNVENLGLISDKSSPLDKRMAAFGKTVGRCGEMLAVYMEASQTPEGILGDEMIELMGFFLQAVSLEPALTTDFLAAVPPDDPKASAEAAGIVDRILHESVGAIEGAVVTLNEVEAYGPGSLVRHADRMLAILPSLLANLPPDIQQRIRPLISNIKTDGYPTDLQAAVKALQAAVANANAPK